MDCRYRRLSCTRIVEGFESFESASGELLEIPVPLLPFITEAVSNTLLNNFVITAPKKGGNLPSMDITKMTVRSNTAWFIEELSKDIQSSFSNNRLVVSTAEVLLQRFYSIQTFEMHDRFIISVACFFLAMKIEESCIKHKHLQTVIGSYVKLRKRLNAPLGEEDLKDIEQKILLAERLVLQTLDFNLDTEHPYQICLAKIKALKGMNMIAYFKTLFRDTRIRGGYIAEDRRNDFHQAAINFLNDSYRTSICAIFKPDDIAAAVILMAAKYMSLKPAYLNQRGKVEESTWLELFGNVDEVAVHSVCAELVTFYDLSNRW